MNYQTQGFQPMKTQSEEQANKLTLADMVENSVMIVGLWRLAFKRNAIEAIDKPHPLQAMGSQ